MVTSLLYLLVFLGFGALISAASVAALATLTDPTGDEFESRADRPGA